jgi:DNA-binding beta-propeller fold protein YncE
MMPRVVAVLLTLAALCSIAHAEYTVETVQLPSGFAPRSAVYDRARDKLYVLADESPRVAAIDVRRATLDTVINVAGTARSLWCDEARGRLYCISGWGTESYLLIVDCATDSVTRSVRAGYSLICMTGDTVTGRVFMGSAAGNGGVYVYDPGDDTVIAHIRTREIHSSLRYNEGVNKLYCYVPGLRVVSLVDCSTMSVRGVVLRGAGEVASYVSTFNHKYYVGSTYLHVLDGYSDSVRFRLEETGVWDSFIHDPVADVVLAGAPALRVVKVLDGMTDSIAGEFRPPTGGPISIYNMAYDLRHNRLLLSDTEGHAVHVYSGAGSLLETVVVPGQPAELLCTPAGVFCVANYEQGSVSIGYPGVAVQDESSSRPAARVRPGLVVVSRQSVVLDEPLLVSDMTGRVIRASAGTLHLRGFRQGVYELIGLASGERRRIVILAE